MITHSNRTFVLCFVFLSLDPEIDSGFVLDAPKEIDLTRGPRHVDDNWWHRLNTFDGFQLIVEAPWAQGADPLLTQHYAQLGQSS